ncbi:LysR family transcriptional regulator [Photobacterium galatheae]|uniref:HTH lysR-type domain-containing protein n=1 Tax=Photobacterium galatheae TaxID=1654360 RepID=A0A066RYP5_9GAMM|nr:LysR family transcriptional regulator [Photobacterium galatheae]KDM92518.1 hypothetical protein EA58_06135 [Photobacterium galatheae]MCM0147994.1 LysR family transcriptional regulator [Photobacterium galatheae]
MNLPSLNALRFFEAAARHQSLVKAADELCVTQSAVSRQIKQLESVLGVTLFERRNRGIFLTKDGVKLRTACHEMLAILKNALKELNTEGNQAPLVVSCEPTIMMKWLIPRLADFKAAHPEIELHLSASGGPIDFVKSQADIAIRRNDFNWKADYHAEPIGPELMGPVILAEKYANGEVLSGSVTTLHTKTRPDAWAEWQQRTNQPVISSDDIWFEHFYIMLEAVHAGSGYGLSSIYMVGSDIRNGQLAAPCGFIPDDSFYYLLSPHAIEADERVGIFLNWLREAFAATREAVLASVSEAD